MVVVLLWVTTCAHTSLAQSINTFTISGPGITVDASCPGQFTNCYTLTLGTVDALGITSNASFTKLPSVPLGELYYSNASMYILVGGSFNNQSVTVTATVTTNFAHSGLLTGQACTAGCGSSTGFTNLATSSTVYSGVEGPALVLDIGALVREVNGAAAFTGNDTEIITLLVAQGNHTKQNRLTINVGPIQTAIMAGITPWSIGGPTDYTLNFGSVNGLGIGGSGSSAQCTAALCPSATLPAVIYYSPQYTFTPAFSNFSSTTATLTAALTTNFSPSAQPTLALCDAVLTTASCNPFPQTIASGIVSHAGVTHYVGLTVREVDGVNAFTGSASAVITFTLSVP